MYVWTSPISSSIDINSDSITPSSVKNKPLFPTTSCSILQNSYLSFVSSGLYEAQSLSTTDQNGWSNVLLTEVCSHVKTTISSWTGDINLVTLLDSNSLVTAFHDFTSSPISISSIFFSVPSAIVTLVPATKQSVTPPPPEEQVPHPIGPQESPSFTQSILHEPHEFIVAPWQLHAILSSPIS